MEPARATAPAGTPLADGGDESRAGAVKTPRICRPRVRDSAGGRAARSTRPWKPRRDLMNRTRMGLCSLLLAGLVMASACTEPGAEEERDEVGSTEQGVSLALLQSRSSTIKSVHAGHPNIHNPLLFAGIAYTETQMAHCYSEYSSQVSSYVCPGPYSSDCGGPVTAGYWDGACSLQAGGLGMWQFDEGNYTQTLNKWNSTGYWNNRPHNVLSVSDSSSAAIDFILFKAWYSSYTPYFSSYQAMYDWINGIRPVNGNSSYETWLGFLANSYNGQPWGSTGWYNTKEKYRSSTSYLYSTLGGDPYWYGSGTPTQPPGQPTGLSPDGWVSVPAGWMTMTWNPVATATSYEVYILYATSSGWTYYYTYYPTTNSVTISPAYHGTSYAWNVKAKNAAGIGPQSNWAYFNEQ